LIPRSPGGWSVGEKFKLEFSMEATRAKLTISLGEEAAWMNQSSFLKSWISLLPLDPSGGQAVPGNLLKKPVLDPKYCHDSAASLSRLFAKSGSRCEDQRMADWTSGSMLDFEVMYDFIFEKLIKAYPLD
jgi:hypothetical protein